MHRATAQINPNGHGGQREHKTDRQTMKERAERGKRGRGGREQLRQDRGREQQEKARQRVGRCSSTPSMHFKTSHSDTMRRVGNLLELNHVTLTGPWPTAMKAKPVVYGHGDLDAMLLGSHLGGEPEGGASVV